MPVLLGELAGVSFGLEIGDVARPDRVYAIRRRMSTAVAVVRWSATSPRSAIGIAREEAAIILPSRSSSRNWAEVSPQKRRSAIFACFPEVEGDPLAGAGTEMGGVYVLTVGSATLPDLVTHVRVVGA